MRQLTTTHELFHILVNYSSIKNNCIVIEIPEVFDAENIYDDLCQKLDTRGTYEQKNFGRKIN